ncbi:MAG: protein kinase [candidate division Zixibacteria bacterium]|nr:protein kinase [candidate division Zixibacteria bacterium]
MDLIPNTVLKDRYRIQEKLATGGMGSVYLSHDIALDTLVAIKANINPGEQSSRQFLREAKLLAALRHQNLPRVTDYFVLDSTQYLVMDYIPGDDLSERLESKGPQPLERVLEWGNQLTHALTYLHTQDPAVIHRDIKPSNIKITPQGHIILVDFGIAKAATQLHETRTGEIKGKLSYMSPEQVMGKEMDHRSDIFSLGVVLYELISGQAPFKGDSEAATLNSVLTATPEPLSRFKANIPERLQGIMDKVLEKSPGERYQHADDLLVDLRKVSAQMKGVHSGEISSESGAAMSASSSSRRFGPLVVAAILALAAATGYFIYDQSGSKKKSVSESEKSAVKTLVVLPFQNLSNSEDEYFADGITDEITSKLAMVKGLRVISRTSAIQYKNSNKSLKEIGNELGVDYILEGTVRWDKSGAVSRVRITPQLIKVADDFHIWADNYERELTQIFAVQSEIATNISQALGVTLLEPEKEAISAEPTGNLEAYDFYLRGVDYSERFSGPEDYELAIQMFEKAVELDSVFYQAHAQLATIYSNQYFRGVDRTKEKLALAKASAERAFRFANGKPEGFLAMGYYYYYGERDFNRALEQFDRALELQPNNSDVLAAAAYVLRRQGKWNESIARHSKATQIDPHSLNKAFNLVDTYLRLRRFVHATKVLERCLELSPDHGPTHIFLGHVHALAQDNPTKLLEGIDNASRFLGENNLREWRMATLIDTREFDSVVKMDCSAADFRITDSSTYYEFKGFAFMRLNESERSQAYFDSARVLGENRIALSPDHAPHHANLSYALAGLGRADEAIARAKRAVEILPLSEDAYTGADMIFNLAVVYLLSGEIELALDKLEFLMTIPSDLNVAGLRNSPFYDPLRDHPRFKALIKKYKNAEAL